MSLWGRIIDIITYFRQMIGNIFSTPIYIIVILLWLENLITVIYKLKNFIRKETILLFRPNDVRQYLWSLFWEIKGITAQSCNSGWRRMRKDSRATLFQENVNLKQILTYTQCMPLLIFKSSFTFPKTFLSSIPNVQCFRNFHWGSVSNSTTRPE